MNDLQFTKAVKKLLITKLNEAKGESYAEHYIGYLCFLANDINCTRSLDDVHSDNSYYNFMSWIKKVGQQLFGSKKQFYFQNAWEISSEPTTAEEENNFRLNKLNERIKQLEKEEQND